MAENATIDLPRADVLTHPAVKAWAELRPARVEPRGIGILKERENSAVYRLEGVGQADSAIIAKRCLQTIAAVERIIYEEVLCSIPLPTLRCFGCVEEGDSDFCWLFLEDAGREQYSADLEEHRRLAGSWLGFLHTSAARLPVPARLPGRGPGHYLGYLYSSRFTLREILLHPGLNADDRAALESLLSCCDLLESHWSQIERFCARMPPILVHGDFAVKNLRVRTGPNGLELFPFDWEAAGWGVPVADFSQLIGYSASPDLTAYGSVVQQAWGHLGVQDLQQLAKIGSIFRLLAAVGWAKSHFAFEWWLKEKPMRRLKCYAAEMSNLLKPGEW